MKNAVLNSSIIINEKITGVYTKNNPDGNPGDTGIFTSPGKHFASNDTPVNNSMHCTLAIRKADILDIPDIREIVHEAFRKYMQEAGLTGTIEALEETEADIRRDIQNKYVFLAVIDSIPVGTIRVGIQPDGTAYISRFGVKPAFANMGVGGALINKVDQLLQEKGIKRVYLHTASKNRDLVRFYYGKGFYVVSTSTERGYIRALMCKEYE